MLGRFSSALQNAVDALAPPPPLHEDFAYHWKRLMRHYLDVTRCRQVPIELTNIPSHIEQLLQLLATEARNGDGVAAGPCAEYLLQHSLLDLLATLAGTDDPPGMRQHVLSFAARLLSHVSPSLVAHSSVYPALLRLVGLCDGSTPTATETDEVHFLLSLTALLRRSPQLLPFFTTPQTQIANESVRRGSCSSDASSQLSFLTSAGSEGHSAQTSQPSHTPPPPNNALFSTPLSTSVRAKSIRLVPPEIETDMASDDTRSLVTDGSAAEDNSIPILDAVLSYIDSPDAGVRVKACQALMLLVSVPEEKLAAAVAGDSLCCVRLASRLTDLCADIPQTTRPEHVEDLTVSWGLDVPLSPCVSCDGCRQVTSFLAWFDFCNQVAAEGQLSVSAELCSAVRERFLEEAFPPSTLSSSLSLSLVAKCVSMATSPILCDAVCRWIVGDECLRLAPGAKPSAVLEVLLSNWTHRETAIVMDTLRLFQLLLEKGNSHVMNTLVYVYISDRSYLDLSVSKFKANGCNNEIIENNDSKDVQLENCNGNKKTEHHHTVKKAEIDEIIVSFLTVVPYELRSGADSGYEQYVSESQRQLMEAVRKRGGPIEGQKRVSGAASTSATGLQPPVFYEGPFLRALFTAIRNLPQLEYLISLELTAIVAALALDPNPALSEYLLDTNAATRPEAATLIQCLRSTATALARPVTAHLDYRRLLADTRRALLDYQADTYRRFDWSGVFECAVVLEELCKELAAIAYVKHVHRLAEAS